MPRLGSPSRFLLPALAALTLLAGGAGPAQSAYPGDNGLIAFTSDRDGSPELFLLDPATSGVTKVAEVAAGGGVPENPVWSPDGSRIAFSRAGAVEVFEPATGGVVPIIDDAADQVAWSPDGTMIAFTRFDAGRRGIWRVNVDGTGEVRLTTGEDQDPAWSPDGGSIAFTRRTRLAEVGFILTDSLYLMNPDGGGQVRADREVYCCSDADPAWSPDGQRIALAEDAGGGNRISVLEVDLNEGPSPVTDSADDIAPAWSPDGTKIVFSRAIPGGRALFTETPDSPAGPVQLTGAPPARDTSPDWQPLPAPAAAPTCSIGATHADEGSGGGARATFEVNCDNPTTSTFSLDWATVDAPGHTGTALPNVDYVPAAGTVAVVAGKSRQQVEVPLVGDTAPEPHETIWVRLSTVDFLLDDDLAQATATIVDDDGFQVSVETKTVPEGGTGITGVPLQVRLSHPADQLVDVFVHAVTDDGARSGFHDINFAPGEVEKEITYDVVGDFTPGAQRRVELAPISWLVTDANSRSGVLTIVDDDVPATLSVGDLTVGEGDGTANVVVTRTNPTGSASFDFSLENGTAIEGDDFGSSSGRGSIADGDLTTTIPVPIADDALDEEDETFAVRISSSDGPPIADDVGVVTITDNDDEPALAVGDAVVSEGDSGVVKAEFTVSLSAPSGKTVRVVYATTDGTATSPGDYAGIPPTELVLSPLTPSATLEVDVRGDTDPEGNETFRVELSGAVNATIADGDGTGTIVDDEPPPTLSIADVSVPEGDSGTSVATFTVTRSHTVGDVTFSFVTEDGSATPIADYFPHGGVVTFAPGSPTATFAVEVAGDALDEDDETFGARLFAPVGATIADGSAVAAIVDDDAAPSVSVDDVSVREGAAGTSTVASFTVTLSAPSGKAVAVTAATSDGSATAPTDYAAAGPTVLTFAGTTTRAFDVIVNGDGDPEANEAFDVRLSAAENATVADGVGVGTILDDEAPANDDFADAALLTPGDTAFDTSLATVEAGEPGLAPFGQEDDYPSVWFQLSPGPGVVTLRAASDFRLTPKRVSIYTGSSLGALTLVARGDTSAGGFPSGPRGVGDVDLQFQTNAGRLYYIQVLGPSAFADLGSPVPGIGRGTLSAVFDAAPANDDFAAAAPLVAGDNPVDTSFASVHPDEPGLSDGSPELHPSVWYTLEPGSGAVALRLHSGVTFAAKRISVYTGSTVSGLSLVAQADNSGGGFPSGPGAGTADVDLQFPSAAGVRYFVQVRGPSALSSAGYFPAVGAGALHATVFAAAANDDFLAAASLEPGDTSFDTSYASIEPDEPGLAPLDPQLHPSVWYSLSPDAGVVSLRAVSVVPFAATAKRVSVYTGSVVTGLTLVARADNSGGTFPAGPHPGSDFVDLEFLATGEELYFVHVLGPSALSGASGFFPGIGAGTLSTTFYPAPANDDFAAAAPLPPGTAAYDTSFAGVETGEPGLATPAESHPSVWYRLSPGLGTAALRAESARPRQVSVYAGAGLGSLTLVGRVGTPSPFPGAFGDAVAAAVDLDVHTVCGATYHVQVLGPSALPEPNRSLFDPTAGQGTVTHGFTPTTLPTNDDFADATTLPLGRTTLPDDWWTCMSAEPGEPAHGGAPAARSLWYLATVGSGRVTVDSPGNRVGIYRGSSLGALSRVADGPTGAASALTTGETLLIAVDGVGGTTVDLVHTPGEVVFGTTAAITTDDPPVGATAADPLETTISGTTASAKSLFETQGATPPSAWSFLEHAVEISAPPLTPPPADPFYTITFRIDGTLVPDADGLPPFTGPVISRPATTVFKDGLPVAASCAGTPRPDPCVFSTGVGPSLGGGDQQDRVITVRSSRASEWTFGTPRRTRGTVAGLLRPGSGGDVEFAAASNGTSVGGALSYGTAAGRFNATSVSALGIDGSRAWFAGVGRDGRPFLAYAEDNGPGTSDRFRLWIGGVEQTDPGGGVTAGNLVVQQP